MRQILSKACLLAVLLFAGSRADASITFYLQGTQFADPGSTFAIGSFTTNDAITAVEAVNITTFDSGAFTGFTYTNIAGALVNTTFFRVDDGTRQFQFGFESPFLSSSGTFPITTNGTSYEFIDGATGSRLFSAGAVTTDDISVPEPTTISLALAGLAGIIVARRRKRA